MTTNLTPDLKAQGWKPIGEVRNEPDDGIYYILEPRPHSAFLEHAPRVTKTDLLFYMRDYPVKKIFYRRLIPVLPNQVIISREDAEFITQQMRFRNGSLTENQELYWENLQAKLEGK